MGAESMHQLLQQGKSLGLQDSFLDVQQLELQARLMQLLLPVQAALDAPTGAAATQCTSTTDSFGSAAAPTMCSIHGGWSGYCCSSEAAAACSIRCGSSCSSDLGCADSSQLASQGPDPAVLQAALAGVQGFVLQLAAARQGQQQQRKQLLQDQQREEAAQLQQQLKGLWEAIPRAPHGFGLWMLDGDIAENELDDLLLAGPSSSSSRTVDWASSGHLLSTLSQQACQHSTQQQQQPDASGLLAAAEAALCFRLGAVLRLGRGLKATAATIETAEQMRVTKKERQQMLRALQKERDGLLSRQAKGQQLSAEELERLEHSQCHCMAAETVQNLERAGWAANLGNAWRVKQQQWRAAVGELQETVLLVGKLVIHVLFQQQQQHAPCQQPLQRPGPSMQLEQRQQRQQRQQQQRLSAQSVVADQGGASERDWALWLAVLQFLDVAGLQELTAAITTASTPEGSSCNSHTCGGSSSKVVCSAHSSSSSSSSSSRSISSEGGVWQQLQQVFAAQAAAAAKLSSSSSNSTLDTSLDGIEDTLQAAASAGLVLLGSIGAFQGLGSAAVQLAELEAAVSAPAQERALLCGVSSSSMDGVARAAAGGHSSSSSSAGGGNLWLLESVRQQQQQELPRQHWLLKQGRQLADVGMNQLGAALLFVGGCYAGEGTSHHRNAPHRGSNSSINKPRTRGTSEGTNSSSSSDDGHACRRLTILAARYAAQEAICKAAEEPSEDYEWQQQQPDDQELPDQAAALSDADCSAAQQQQLQQGLWTLLAAVQPSLCRALCFAQLPPECQTYEAFEAAVLGWVAPKQQQQQQGEHQLLSSCRMRAALSGACGLQQGHVLCRHCRQSACAYPGKVSNLDVERGATAGSAQDAASATAAAQLHGGDADNRGKSLSAAGSSSSSSCGLSSEELAGLLDNEDTFSTDSNEASYCDVRVDYCSSTSQVLWGWHTPSAPPEACCAAAECVLAEVQQQVAGGLAALPAGALTQQQWLMALHGPLSELPLLGCSAESR
jgi:hypothetical protein